VGPISLAKRGTGRVHRSRLTRYDVEQIRKWAKGPGFGLTFAEQTRQLRAMAQYNTMAPESLKDVLNNDSWYDPNYDRGSPLSLPVMAQPSLVTWFLFLLMLCRTPALPTNHATKCAITQ
jgi:hypothetical protein